MRLPNKYYFHVPMQDSEVRDNTKMYQKQFMTTLLPDKVLNINNHSAWAVLNICITVVFLICLNTLPCIAADACSLGIFCLFLICCGDLLLLLTNIVITLNNLIFFLLLPTRQKDILSVWVLTSKRSLVQKTSVRLLSHNPCLRVTRPGWRGTPHGRVPQHPKTNKGVGLE